MPLPYCYEHPRPAVTVDIVACAFDGAAIRVLLIKRKSEPYKGKWALPGGFMEIDEHLHQACLRELVEETGLHAIQDLHMLGVFDDIKRDPRGRVLSVAFGALLRWPAPVEGGDDAERAEWVRESDIEEPLAFDHAEILDRGMHWLALTVMSGSGGLAMLPESFSTRQARALFKALHLPLAEVNGWIKRMYDEGLISAKEKPAPPRKRTSRRGTPKKKRDP